MTLSTGSYKTRAMDVDAHRSILLSLGIEFDSGPVYFSLNPQRDHNESVKTSETKTKRKKISHNQELEQTVSGMLIPVFRLARNPVRGILTFSRLQKAMERLSCRDKLNKFCRCHWYADDTDEAAKGFAVFFEKDNEASQTETQLQEVANLLKNKFELEDYYRLKLDVQTWQWTSQTSKQSLEGECLHHLLVPMTTKPSAHPVFHHEEFSPVYHSYERAKHILQEVSDEIPAAKKTLEVAAKYIDETVDVAQLQARMKYPLIIIEGLDACGKSTLTRRLADRLNAVQLCTPPPCIAEYRRALDDYPEFIRRAYYSLSNYIVVYDIVKACQSQPVVMDRYWHSTAAYAIAHESGEGDISVLPNRGHDVYNWPSDLLEPSAVLLLTVSEEIRSQRLNLRTDEKTWEEKYMSKDLKFRQRLEEAYRRMNNPPCLEIDASPSKEEVEKNAFERLKTLQII